MVMLSELVGRPVTDGFGRGGHVADFAIDLSVPDYPPIWSVLVESREAPRMIPWSGIRREEGHFRVENLGAAQQVDDDRLQSTVFAVGLLGASLLAAGVLPVATAYSVAEAFGFRKGLDLDYRRAPIFITLFSVLVAGGALIAMIPNVPVFALLIAIQVLNAVLMPITLFFILRLSGQHRLMGDLVNGRVRNILGWVTAVAVSVLALTMLASLAAEAVGIDFFGGLTT